MTRVLWNILLVMSVCFFSIPAPVIYSDDTAGPQAHEEDFETDDFSRFPWSHSGDTSWETTRQHSHSGNHCAKSGSIDHDESTTLEMTLDCVSGDITFYRKVSSESGFDYLKFYIDGEEQGKWSGKRDWAEVSFSVEEGTRTFAWTYSKDSSVSEGDDAAWIDDIVFPVEGSCCIEAGELRMILEHTGQGFRLLSLSDLVTGVEFIGPILTENQLFRVDLQDTESDRRAVLRGELGWNLAHVDSNDDLSWIVTYELPMDSRLFGTTVTLPIRVDTSSNALHLGLQVHGVPEPWAVTGVRFPNLNLAKLGAQTRVLVPQLIGRVLDESFNYYGVYPSWSASMSYVALYDSHGEAGLYVGTHDPWANLRTIGIGDNSEQDGIQLTISYPAPNSDQPGNGFQFPGEAVLQLFRGDWYDATLIYRDWVRANAKWYPKLSENGREDTPLWMKELPAWIAASSVDGTKEGAASWVQQYRDYMSVPVGLRLKNWHQKPPGVNDDPHYFPEKPGFLETFTVLRMQEPPIYVMPYIDGVYWDVRDRGTEDFQFTSVGLSGAVKNENGEPVVITSPDETEADGSPVQVAIMCPTSTVWKEKLQELVLKLTREYDVKAVYMDGIANLRPIECFDHTHGHPAGGGSWWAQGYCDILQSIREAMPPDCILTTESNGEAYVHVFDGFLVQWESPNDVPAFPAIYGGAIQMFGQRYNLCPRPTMALAHRMQGAQSFVFGEQIGGGAGLPLELESSDFLKQVIQLRWELRRFFYAGEMARPPKLSSSIPTVTADRHFDGIADWVTTDAVLTGAWRIPHEQRLALLFVNISDNALAATFDFDATKYGLPSGELKGTVVVSPTVDQVAWGRARPPSNPGVSLPLPSTFQKVLGFPRHLAWAWIIEP